MNILIVGEFSSFAKHLASGFRQLGHYVVIVHTGDVWKKIPGTRDDINYRNSNIRIAGKEIKGSWILKSRLVRRRLHKELESRFSNKDVDLVFVVNFAFLSKSLFQTGVSISYLKKLVAGGSKMVMSICGFDPACYYFFPNIYKWKVSLTEPRYTFLIKNSDTIIPTALSYREAIEAYCENFGYDKTIISPTIPLPITVEENYKIDSCVGRKIVIFHGIIRPEMKGSSFIKEAMDRLQLDFPDKVTCVCKGGMPYDEYLKLFEKVDILIDQASEGGRGWGMNAAIGAMKGKCVLTCSGDDVAQDMGFESIPFVDIKRDSNQIYETLKELILSPEKIDEKKKESRKFIEENCDSKIVAQRYLEMVGLA